MIPWVTQTFSLAANITQADRNQGGIIALGLTMQPKRKSIAEIKELFHKPAEDAFEKPHTGSLIERLDPYSIISKTMMFIRLTTSRYPTKPLELTLKEFFGKDTNLFSAACKTNHQRTVRVAVTSTTNQGNDSCLISNYNRPFPIYHVDRNAETPAKSEERDDLVREEKHANDFKIWEAALATSAAPIYFPPFLKHETNCKYYDSALRATFPGKYAIKEMGRIWGNAGNKPPPPGLDILLAVSTGNPEQKPVPKLWKAPGFDAIYNNVVNMFDSESKFRAFVEEMRQSKPEIHRKIHRLNLDIKGKTVDLDDYRKMTTLEETIRSYMKRGLHGEVSPLAMQVGRLANMLVANLFFIEPDDNTTAAAAAAQPSEHKFSGTVRCRLPLDATMKTLITRVTGFWLYRLPSNKTCVLTPPLTGSWERIATMTKEEQAAFREGDRLLRLPVKINEPDLKTVLAIVVTFDDQKRGEEPTSLDNASSGFPVSFQELKDKAKLARLDVVPRLR